MFKLGIGNDLGIPEKWYCFGVQKSKVKVAGSLSSFRILELCILEPRFIDIYYVALAVVCGFADA